MVNKKICFITGTRAEYGLLKPLMELIKSDKNLELQLIVTGMHLSPEFGMTYKEIEKDGFYINKKIEILLSSDTPAGLSKSMGLAQISLTEAYEELKPYIIIVLGDRFEILSAVISALLSRIPVAHLYGGEATYGLIDEAIRHSITKMSYIHFTSTEEYKKRVIQLGEAPDRVFTVGALGVDNIKKLTLLPKKVLEKKLNFSFNKHNLLVTFHPVTLEQNTSGEQFQSLLEVIDELKETNILFTKANADTDGRIINKMIDEYTSKNSHKSICFTSMGQMLYLSTMRYVDAVVGNSSSGIIEAPSFKVGTINIGDRQKGRIKAESVVDCDAKKVSIKNAFNKLYSDDFKEKLKKVVSPYGNGTAAKKIIKIIKTFNIIDLKKIFYDITCC